MIENELFRWKRKHLRIGKETNSMKVAKRSEQITQNKIYYFPFDRDDDLN